MYYGYKGQTFFTQVVICYQFSEDWCGGGKVAYGTDTGWWEECKGWGSNKDLGAQTRYGETAE